MTTSPLGVGALVVAIAAAAVEVIATPIELSLQLRGGAPFGLLVLVAAIVIGIIALVGLVLGIVAVRGDATRAVPFVAIGVAGYVLIGQLAGVLGALIALVV